MKKELSKNQLKMVSDSKLFNELENQKIIIFDFRPRKQFIQSSILNYSINLPSDEIKTELFENPGIIDKKLLEEFAHTEFLRRKANELKRNFIVIIMSEDKIKKEEILKYFTLIGTKDETNISEEIVKPLKFYITLITNKVREIGILNCGYWVFKTRFPFLVHINQEPPKIFKGINGFHGFPSIILTNRLYVGDQYHVNNYN